MEMESLRDIMGDGRYFYAVGDDHMHVFRLRRDDESPIPDNRVYHHSAYVGMDIEHDHLCRLDIDRMASQADILPEYLIWQYM